MSVLANRLQLPLRREIKDRTSYLSEPPPLPPTYGGGDDDDDGNGDDVTFNKRIQRSMNATNELRHSPVVLLLQNRARPGT